MEEQPFLHSNTKGKPEVRRTGASDRYKSQRPLGSVY